jgi:hypothetical protein
MTNTRILVIAIITIVCGVFAFARMFRSSRPLIVRTTVVHQGQNPIAMTDPDFPPKPKWKPTVPVDIPRTIEKFSYYTNRKRAFAIFKHGTCVLLPEGSKETEKDAKEILDKVYQHHPDFNSQAMDDGNFMVSYSQPAYSVVFKDEVEAHREYIDQNHLDGVVRAEVLLNAKGEPNKFDERGKIGLFGRARMFLDAQNPTVLQVWRPQ